MMPIQLHNVFFYLLFQYIHKCLCHSNNKFHFNQNQNQFLHLFIDFCIGASSIKNNYNYFLFANLTTINKSINFKMQENNHNDTDEYDLIALQDSLFNRLKNLYLEEDEPYFMINYKPQPHGKCFLTTDDINKHAHNGCLIFPKTFCKRLCALAKPIQRDQQQIEEIVSTFVERMKEGLMKEINQFGETIKNHLTLNVKPYEFFKKFHKGNYKEDVKLLQELEEIIEKWEDYEENLMLNSMDDILQQIGNQFEKSMKEIKVLQENLLVSLQKTIIGCKKLAKRKLGTDQVKDYSMPKSFELIDNVEINEGKAIPWGNGIDVHPSKNMYVAIGCRDGDLVIVDQDIGCEINRIKLNNNSGGSTQNCLWSPSGDKIMMSTRENHSLYIYGNANQKLLRSIENTYSQNGYGTIWLSEQEAAVGYGDGMVKFFNVDEGKEIRSIKVNGTCAWGMDCVDDSHLLVGDYSGSITSIDWKNNKIEWIKTGWHSSSTCFCCLRLNQNKTKLLTGNDDGFVKMMKLQDQSKSWEFKMNSYVYGILWVPGELYVLALSYRNQLVALNSCNGDKIIEFNGLTNNLMSLRLIPRTAEILIGDEIGIVSRLKICQAQAKNKINFYCFTVIRTKL